MEQLSEEMMALLVIAIIIGIIITFVFYYSVNQQEINAEHQTDIERAMYVCEDICNAENSCTTECIQTVKESFRRSCEKALLPVDYVEWQFEHRTVESFCVNSVSKNNKIIGYELC